MYKAKVYFRILKNRKKIWEHNLIAITFIFDVYNNYSSINDLVTIG